MWLQLARACLLLHFPRRHGRHATLEGLVPVQRKSRAETFAMSIPAFFAPSPRKGSLRRWDRSASPRLLALSVVVGVVLLLLGPLSLRSTSLSHFVEKDTSVRSTALESRNLGGENVSSPQALLLARAADANTPPWRNRVTTGRMVWCLMNSNPQAAQSRLGPNDLARWGWEETMLTSFNIQGWQEFVEEAYEEYGIAASNVVGAGYMHVESFEDANGNEQAVSLLTRILSGSANIEVEP